MGGGGGGKQANESKCNRSAQISFLGSKGQNPQPSQGLTQELFVMGPYAVQARNVPVSAGVEPQWFFSFFWS